MTFIYELPRMGEIMQLKQNKEACNANWLLTLRLLNIEGSRDLVFFAIR